MAWELDNAHSEVGFAVKHMMISTVRGKFTSFSGTLSLDPNDLEHASAKGVVDTASIDTGEEKRDGHLRSADFFDAENHPQITFDTKKVKREGSSIEVTGDLTIHGKSNEVTLKGTVEGPAKDPWGNQRVGFELAGEIDREAFGLTWNQALETGGLLVAKKVKIDVALQAVQK